MVLSLAARERPVSRAVTAVGPKSTLASRTHGAMTVPASRSRRAWREQADLWSVAVGDDKRVVTRQRRQRLDSLHDVRFLDVRLGPLAALQERIAAERGDYLHSRSPIVAIMVALMVCSLFSASSNTMDADDSKTSSVTSSASRPRRA